MKNHKKAKKLYEETDPQKKFLEIVVKKIHGMSGDGTLKGLIESISIEFASDEPKKAIGALEALYEALGSQRIQEYLCDSGPFHSEWKSTNRDNLFDIAFNSMYKTAKQYHKEDVLEQLETYKEYIKNHDKAKKLYEETDPQKEFLIMVVDKIHNAPGKYTLKGLMEDLGARFAHDEPAEAISLLEAIYEALNIEEEFIEQKQLNLEDKNKSLDEDNKLSRDALFSEAFYSMYEIAERHRDQDLLNALEEYYPAEQEQVSVIGGGDA